MRFLRDGESTIGSEIKRQQNKYNGEEDITKVRTIIQLKHGKARGVDGVVSETVKNGGDTSVVCIWKMCMIAEKSFCA